VAVTRDYHALALEGAIDQLGELVLGFGDTVSAHTSIYSYLMAIMPRYGGGTVWLLQRPSQGWLTAQRGSEIA